MQNTTLKLKWSLKNKDEESTSKFIVPEVPAITMQISKHNLETPDQK